MGFGRGLLWDDQGDLVYDTTTKEHKQVTGNDVLAQDARMLLKTIQGDDPIYPTLGIPMLEIFAGAFDQRLIEARFREQLLKDPRIASVDRVVVGLPDADRKVMVDIGATAVDGSSFSTSLFFETGGSVA